MEKDFSPHVRRYHRRLGFEAVTFISSRDSVEDAGWDAGPRCILSQGERDFAGYFALADVEERIRCKALLLLRAALLSVTAPESRSPRARDWADLRRDFEQLSFEVASSPAFARLNEAEQYAMWRGLLTLDSG